MASTTEDEYIVIEEADIVDIDENQYDQRPDVEEALGGSRANPIRIDDEEPNSDSVTESVGATDSQVQTDFNFHEAERLAILEELYYIDQEEYEKQVYEEVEFLRLKEMVQELANAINN